MVLWGCVLGKTVMFHNVSLAKGAKMGKKDLPLCSTVSNRKGEHRCIGHEFVHSI